jgi:hypothetical protein
MVIKPQIAQNVLQATSWREISATQLAATANTLTLAPRHASIAMEHVILALWVAKQAAHLARATST